MGRRVMHHPEARHATLNRKVAAGMSAKDDPWRRDNGWLLTLVEMNGTKHYRDLPARMTYAEAIQTRDSELSSDPRYTCAWLKQKGYGKT